MKIVTLAADPSRKNAGARSTAMVVATVALSLSRTSLVRCAIGETRSIDRSALGPEIVTELPDALSETNADDVLLVHLRAH